MRFLISLLTFLGIATAQAAPTSSVQWGYDPANPQAVQYKVGTTWFPIPLLTVANTWAQAQTFTVSPIFSATTAHGLLLGQGASAITSIGPAAAGQMLLGQGVTADAAFAPMSGDATLAGTGTLTLATVNAAPGTYGSNMTAPQVTVDGKGRITSVSANPFVVGNVKFYGAKGDTVPLVNVTVSIASGSNALTVVGGVFSAGDIGKKIRVPYAGSAGGLLSTTISSVTDATHVTLATNASTTLTSRVATVIYGTDDTSAIQAALTAVNAAYFPSAFYFTTATLNGGVGCKVTGDGPELSRIIRTDAFGDTVQCGSASGAGAAQVSGLWFWEPQEYLYGTTTALPFSATAGACHIRLYGAQGASIKNNYVSYLPNGFCFNGGTLSEVSGNKTWGIWDPNNAPLQEGLSAISLVHDATYGAVKDIRIVGNQAIGGLKTGATESFTFTSTCGNVAKSILRPIGPKYGIYAEDGETVEVSGNFFGGLSYNEIYINNKNVFIGWRVSNNKFDDVSPLSSAILISSDAAHYAIATDISGNEFNGEGAGLNALLIDNPTSTQAAFNTTFSHNNVHAFAGSPIVNRGGVALNVTGNIITDYNTQGVCTTDPAYASGMYIYGNAGYTSSADNEYGSGGNTDSTASPPNYTAWGVYSALANVAILGPDRNLGVLTAIYGGSSTTAPKSFWGRVGINNAAPPGSPLDLTAEVAGNDTLIIRPPTGLNFVTVKPEAASNLAVLGYWTGGVGWGSMSFPSTAIFGSRVKITDQGSCTMTAGACAAQTLGSTYTTAPTCIGTWTGTGALAGTIKMPSTTTTVTPASSNGADTAVVNWACFGN